jgi:hypothetical protein
MASKASSNSNMSVSPESENPKPGCPLSVAARLVPETYVRSVIATG